jgi:hypothetical protein
VALRRDFFSVRVCCAMVPRHEARDDVLDCWFVERRQDLSVIPGFVPETMVQKARHRS